MKTLSGKRVLVTGGGSGIGRCMAKEFAARGAEVLIADRNVPAAEAAAAELGGLARAYGCDVSDVAAIRALRERLLADGGPIDVLVNNAGVVFGGPFLDVPLERHVATYAVNTVGLVSVTHVFLPDLIDRPEAHLVNVASASGYVGLPYGTTYASSKWAVIGFSESLTLELELQGRTHVHVTTACPSYVSTGMFHGVRPPTATELLTPEVLGARIVEGVLRDERVIDTPWLVAITPIMKGILPRRAFDWAVHLLGVNTSMIEWQGRTQTGAGSASEPPRAAAGGER